jgi:DNA polymerase-3 subunit delta
LRISGDKLAPRLSKRIPAALLLCGDEPLLIEESADQVRQAARDQGFEERTRLTVEPGFKWARLVEESASLSLFASRRLLELRMPAGRPGEAGTRAIGEYCAEPPPDTALVVITGRLEPRSRRSRWVRAIEQAGVVAEHPALRAGELPAWIGARLRSRGLRADREALQLLCHYVEGNLLAAAQEIDKLMLLCRDGQVTTDRVRETIADHARFNVYALADACLAAEPGKALRILDSLRGEGVEAVLVAWALSRELRTLAQISAGLSQGRSRAQLFKAYNVWSRRAPAIDAALNRHGLTRWWGWLQQMARIDRIIKGLEVGDAWLTLERVCLAMCGIDTVVQRRTG